MEKKKYCYYKEDLKDLITSFNKLDIPSCKADLLRWIDACADYTFSVVRHTAFSKSFMGYSSSSSRLEMEDLNRRRTQKHDEAIRLTMTLNRNIKLLTGGGAYFADLNNIKYLENRRLISDLSYDERYELGQLFFQTSSIIASLTPEEVKEFGLENLRNDIKLQTRRYGIKNLGTPDKDGYIKDFDDYYDEITY